MFGLIWTVPVKTVLYRFYQRLLLSLFWWPRATNGEEYFDDESL